jgi:tripartite-type tricarboxylate transporter receptor subunit TctC
MKLTRRTFIQSTVVIPAAASLAGGAFAQEYPAREIRIVFNYPAGSGGDILTRFLAGKLSEMVKQPVIVDNKVGAQGNIATEFAARAKPDGYTILVTPGFTTMAGAKHLFKKPPFDPVKDFVPVTTLCQAPFILVVDPKSNIKSVAELTKVMKDKAGKGAYGIATNTGIAVSELYRQTAGFEAQQIRYKDTAASVTDMLSGQIDFVLTDAVSVIGQVKDGSLKALAWTTEKRGSALPDLPTFKESGVESVSFAPWWGVFAPAGTPQPIVSQLEAWFNKIVAMEDTQKFFANSTLESLPGNSEKLRELLAKSLNDWAEYVKLAKIEPQ